MVDVSKAYVDAEAARSILDDPLFRKVVAEIEREQIGKWRNSVDQVERETLHASLVALDMILGELKSKLHGVEFARRGSLI